MKLKPAVLITGAGTGIGAATARLFSENGHDVILVGRRKAVLEKTAKNLKSSFTIISADITKSNDVSRLIKESLKAAPHLGILVNNAGVFERASFSDSNDEIWSRIFETNLLGLARVTRALLPHFMKGKSGVIVNVASTAGLRPVAGMTAYAAIKAGVIGLTQSLALELAPQGIRVNAICPGVIETPILGLEKLDKGAREKVIKQMSSMHPLGRMGQPEDVAWGIYQLSNENSSWVTGVVLPVDGGISLQ